MNTHLVVVDSFLARPQFIVVLSLNIISCCHVQSGIFTKGNCPGILALVLIKTTYITMCILSGMQHYAENQLIPQYVQ